ncbi:DUF423 domain-containing protein [Neptunomonas antarctica]|uniref:Uncharacterized membrane protein YgdD, TMEM256/DUF423 family n=1 Tax=Neptunomonas antarctica TaxID=619304 RepID=A0A1N7IYS4_9GAMM|nr:DUF423 domain-containing protein [Neptunomonas antarctica]SIS42219.1 Uncharacterized membrane protein YgdD, TMEM256/DUF423 family [Neptunomonas antarctica]
MNARIYLAIAAISGALSVAMGAFAAHSLKNVLSAPLMAVMQTGVQYQFYHSIALLVVGLLLRQQASRLLTMSATAFVVGILLFCGSLYLLAFSGVHWLGIVTPVGGLAFIVGWILLAGFFLTESKR